MAKPRPEFRLIDLRDQPFNHAINKCEKFELRIPRKSSFFKKRVEVEVASKLGKAQE